MNLAERTIYELGASVGLTQGRVRPAMHVIVPLEEDLRNDMDFVIGVGVAIATK